LRALMRLNRELLYEQIQKLALRRLTIDLDGTVIRTGANSSMARLVERSWPFSLLVRSFKAAMISQ
jgi:hypothetical protein